jgi:hypothetical protein
MRRKGKVSWLHVPTSLMVAVWEGGCLVLWMLLVEMLLLLLLLLLLLACMHLDLADDPGCVF